MVTAVPGCPDVGVKEVTEGGGTKLNPANDEEPYEVVTTTFPDAPLPTTAVIVVALATINDVAFTPPKLTPVTPTKFEPVIVTVVPTAPEARLNEVMTGGPT